MSVTRGPSTTWCAAELGPIVDASGGLVRTGPFGAQLHRSDYTLDPGGTPVVMPKDMADGRVDLAAIARVDGPKLRQLADHRLAAGDIVLARRGDIGRCAWIGEREDGFLCGTGSLRISVGRGPLHPRFLYYVLLDRGSRSWLQGQAVGSTMPNLNAAIVRQLPVRFPGRDAQERVVDVLTAFDELVGHNRRRIEILDEAARSLYREWFVHRRFPGHDARGHDTSGWTAATLRDHVTVNPASTNPSTWDQVRYVDITGLGERSLTWPAPSPGAAAPGRARRLAADGDVVHATVRPDRRAHALVVEPPPHTVFSTGLAVLRPIDLPPSYLFEVVSDRPFTDHLAGRATGAAYPAVKPRDFEDAPLVLPAPGVLDAFRAAVEPLHRLAARLRTVNARLSSARDELLPRLVTGRLDVASLGVDDVFGWTDLTGS